MDSESKKNSDQRLPAVSIGMPIFNDEKYVSRALDDLLAQTFEDFELIISDNGSTDQTEEICRKYAAMDRRIRYHRQPRNLGAQNNFTFVLNHARGEFFMWAGSDDRWDKDFIRSLLDALRSDDRLVSAFCPFINMDENDQRLGRVIKFDFSGGTSIRRILRFNLTLDNARDSFVYGLHRRQLIKDMKIPVWWWINANIPMNTVYPVLTFFLARGGYIQVGTKPLWLRRKHFHSKPRHRKTNFEGSYTLSHLAFMLRKVNVLCESMQAVYKGSESLPVVIAVFPVLAARCVYDCLKRSAGLCRDIIFRRDDRGEV